VAPTVERQTAMDPERKPAQVKRPHVRKWVWLGVFLVAALALNPLMQKVARDAGARAGAGTAVAEGENVRPSDSYADCLVNYVPSTRTDAEAAGVASECLKHFPNGFDGPHSQRYPNPFLCLRQTSPPPGRAESAEASRLTSDACSTLSR